MTRFIASVCRGKQGERSYTLALLIVFYIFFLYLSL